MKKAVIGTLLIFTGLLFWFFATGNNVSPVSFIPPSYYKKDDGDSRNHVPKTDLVQLAEKQPYSELKDVVESLRSETFRFEDKVITLDDGAYYGKMNDKKVSFDVVDIFFSPTDKTGKEAAVIIAGYREKRKKETAYYLFTRLPDGALSYGSFIGNDVHVHEVNIKSGIITLSHHLAQEDPLTDSRFALTKKKKGATPSIEPLPATLVIK